MVNILGFLSHTASAATTQFCHYCMKAAIKDMYTDEHVCVPIKHYFQEQMQARFVPWAIVS